MPIAPLTRSPHRIPPNLETGRDLNEAGITALCLLKKRGYTKSSLLLDFRRGAQRVPPVCFGVLFGANRNGEEQAALSPHGRDGHAPFLRFKV